MLNDFSIIRTRITPPRRWAELVERPRLLHLLSELIEKKLVLVSAPAGYGKTSLLIDYAASAPLPICWYSVDRLDYDPQRFIAYFTAAIQQKFPAFGARTYAALAGSQNSLDMDYLTSVIVNDLYDHISEHFVLILDDFHLVNDSPSIGRFTSSILQHTEENCHFVLTSRSLLSLQILPLLAARSEVGGISLDELVFNADEIQQLYRQNQHQMISLETAKEIQKQTEGWVTGIILASQVNEDLNTARARLARVSGFGLEEYYLQIIDALPDRERDFLLWTSLLEEFNLHRCVEVLGPALGSGNELTWQEMMSSLQRNNLFLLPVGGDEEGWVRYHPLFLDFLQTRVFQEQAENARKIELRLAEVYIQNSDWDQAFAIYHRLNSVEEMTDLIISASADLIAGGRVSTLSTWLDALPGTELNSRPFIIALQGYVAMFLGDPQLALSLYNQAINALNQPEDQIFLARSLLFRATLNRIMGQLNESIADAKECLSLIQNRLDLREIQGDAMRTIGQCYFHQGQLHDAIQALEQALQMMISIHDSKNEAIIRLELGVVYENLGEYSISKHEYQTALSYWQQVDNPIYLSNLLNNLGVIQQMTGEYEQASQSFEEAYQHAHQIGYARMEAFVLAGIGDIYMELQAFEQAMNAYQRAGEIANKAQERFLQVYILVQQASLVGYQGNLEEGFKLLSKTRDLIGQSGSEMQRYLFELEYAGLHLYQEQEVNRVIPLLEDVCAYFVREGHQVQQQKAHLYLVLAYQQTGKPEKQLEHLLHLVGYLDGEFLPSALIALAARFSDRLLSHKPEILPEGVTRFYTQIEEFQKKLPSLRRYLREHARAVPFAPPTLYIRALGKMQVQIQNQTITNSDWQTQAARDLFFLLLAHPEGMTKDEISLIFWPDATLDEARFRFKNTVYRMRHAVGRETVLLEQDIYRFNNNLDYEYDVELFLKECAQANKTQDQLQKLAHYREAVKQYRGTYLPDVEETWIYTPRENLAQNYLDVLLQVSEIYFEMANYTMAMDYCQRALNEDPLFEDAHRLALRIFAATGNRAGVIRQYQRCAEVLEREFNAKPSPQTQALYQELLK